ncbi:hypothetical protein TorRG33x02_290920 [Trema orientale]|uniref:Uncharacterized protein n=1 Tax=Trema orientale TaxID=63057 RepID=A0A2P5CBX6_TREOI|nr:hypothetical protein TorRG33x02_290920 [Trema orientale]
MENISDSLALAGHHVENDNMVMCILTVLPSDYDPVVGAILTRGGEMLYHEVQSLLLSQETRIEQATKAFELQNPSAHFVSGVRGRGGRNGHGNYSIRGRGRGSGHGNGGSLPTCQICRK